MVLLPHRAWGTGLQAPVFPGGASKGGFGCTPGLRALPTHLLGAVVSLRGPSRSADHLPGPASPSSLQRDKENLTEVIQPLDGCEFCQPCCPSAQGRDILWGLRLVTPPDLQNLSQ